MASGSHFLSEGSANMLDSGVSENEYYSFERLKNINLKNNTSDLTIIVVNIESLPSNMNYLTSTLRLLNFSPDIIALSETRITEKSNSYYNAHLENYKYFPSPKSTSRAGSSGVFVRNSLSVTMRADLDISVPGIFETVWLDIDQKLRGKKSTFGVVYRHCGDTDIPFFQRKLEPVLSKLNQSNSDFYIVGDFNCNTLKYDELPNVKSFLDMMHSNSAVNLVNKPTRFPRGDQWGSPYVLDHFYTNEVAKVNTWGYLLTTFLIIFLS